MLPRVRPPRSLATALPALAALAGLLSAAGAARADWSGAITLSDPTELTVEAPQLALSPTGGIAVAFAAEDPAKPAGAQSYLALGSAGSGISAAQPLGSTQAVLGLAFDGPSAQLLTGISPPGTVCCTTAQAIGFSSLGVAQAPRTLAGAPPGAQQGQVLALTGGRLLAALATAQGVWAGQSTPHGGVPGLRQISAQGEAPTSLAAVALPGGASRIAFSDVRRIHLTSATRLRGPQGSRVVVTVPAGHTIDELALTGHGTAATLGWIESWSDRLGLFHSEPVMADVGAGRVHAHAIAVGSAQASGISLAADPQGDQALAWQACTADGACRLQGAVRRAGGRFGAAQSLGAIDPGEPPAVALGPGGQAFAAWIRGGRVLVSQRLVGRGRFAAARAIAGSGSASGLTLGFDARGDGCAAWTQGASSTVVAASLWPAG